MDELALLIADKLNLTFEFVESHFEDVFTRYIEYEIFIKKTEIVVFIVGIVIPIMFMCLLSKKYEEALKNKKSNILIDYVADSWIDLELVAIFLLVFAIVSLFISLVGLPISITKLFGWMKAPEIMAIKALGGL